MYYIWSIVITLIIFIIIQYFEKKRCNENNEDYNLFTLSNLLVIGILYLIITVISYFLYNNKDIMKNNKDIEIDKDHIDPNILKKIPDNINVGFEPFDNE
jgi:predicted PurR-regulated permease PerM